MAVVTSDPWSRLAGYDRAHPVVADTIVALAVAAAATPSLVLRTHDPARQWPLLVLLVAPLAARRRYPARVMAAISAVALVQWFTAGPLLADAALLVAAFTVALERPRVEAVAAWVVLEVGVVMASLRWHFTGSWVRSVVGLSGLAAAAVLAGAAYRARRAHLRELTERAARLETERDQQARMAAAAERTRIAREMHDVIAHSLAVMITMAEGAAAKLERDPSAAADAVDSVIEVGRQALGETRRLVGVLRDRDGGPELAPQPGLEQLDELVAQVRRAGLDATLTRSGRPWPLPPGAELTVYRVVQEATTNALKHAPGATRLEVTVTFDHPKVQVSVVDDGRAEGPEPVGSGTSPGHGLAVMAERLALYDGRLDAGPVPGGGWAVRASMRLPAPRAVVAG